MVEAVVVKEEILVETVGVREEGLRNCRDKGGRVEVGTVVVREKGL